VGVIIWFRMDLMVGRREEEGGEGRRVKVSRCRTTQDFLQNKQNDEDVIAVAVSVRGGGGGGGGGGSLTEATSIVARRPVGWRE